MNKQQYLFINIISWIIGVLFIILPFFAEFYIGKINEVITLFSACLAILVVSVAIFQYRTTIKITTTDFCVILYLIYSCMLIVFKDIPIDPVKWFEWFGLIVIYIIARQKLNTRIILSFIVISGLLQAGYGIIQEFILKHSNHSYFVATGSFHNPGPWGGYLAISFSILTYEIARHFQEEKLGIKLGVKILSLSILGFALFRSDSRAAWISVIVTLLILLIALVKQKNTRVWISSFAVLFLLLFTLHLYNYRKNSANARLLIWKVSITAACETPLTGHGVSSFSHHYMLHQAEYFKANHNESEALIAGNNSHAFNEYIRLFYEQGVIGVVLFLLIIGSVFSNKINEKISNGAKLGLLSLLVFSCFSYPSDIIALKAFFPLFIGLLPGKEIKTIIPSSKYLMWYKFAGISTGIILFSLSAKERNLNHQIYLALDDFYYEGDDEIIPELEQSIMP